MQQLVEEVDGDELTRYDGSVLQITKMPEPAGRFTLKMASVCICRKPTSAFSSSTLGQCCRCKFISSGGGIILSFKFAIIHSEPATTSVTMSTPNASASTLLVLSGPVVMWRKKTR